MHAEKIHRPDGVDADRLPFEVLRGADRRVVRDEECRLRRLGGIFAAKADQPQRDVVHDRIRELDRRRDPDVGVPGDDRRFGGLPARILRDRHRQPGPLVEAEIVAEEGLGERFAQRRRDANRRRLTPARAGRSGAGGGEGQEPAP